MAAFRLDWMVCGFAALALTVAGAPARAQSAPAGDALAADAPESSRETARRLFQEGVEAFRAGRYKDAVDALMAADKAMHSPAFSFNIGIAYEAMGDDASALRWLRHYVREVPDADDRAEVDQKISDLEGSLRARGVQQVSVLSQPESATLLLDGRPVGLTPWTGEIHPGKHKVVLQLSGYEDAQRTFELHPHRAADVSIALTPARPTEPPRPLAAVKDAPVADEEPSGAAGPWPWIAFGAGAGSFGVALAFEIARASAVDDASTAPQVDYRDRLDAAKSRQTAARLFAALGTALVVTGGVLLVVDLTDEPDSPSIGLGYGPGGCGPIARGSF